MFNTAVPAEVGSEGFDLVARGKEGREYGGVRPSELVALITVVHRQLLLTLELDNLPQVFDILNSTLHPEPPSSAVVFLCVSRPVILLFPPLSGSFCGNRESVLLVTVNFNFIEGGSV